MEFPKRAEAGDFDEFNFYPFIPLVLRKHRRALAKVCFVTVSAVAH